MSEWLLKVKDLPRQSHFPFRVGWLYYCNETFIHTPKMPQKTFEVCLRLYSKSGYTEDIVDGVHWRLPCPNVVWKMPGALLESMPSVRDTISFSYPSAVLPTLELLGMKTDPRFGWSFAMSSELEALIAKFRTTVHALYTPGMPDILDWNCFCLMGTLMQQGRLPMENQSEENRIRNVSLWFRTHFSESINLDEVAAANGMSRAGFYRAWRKFFDMSPSQFVIDLRLEAAARRLRETGEPISEIVREIHFSGEYLFYRRFRRKYGMTPHEYRQLHLAEEAESGRR